MLWVTCASGLLVAPWLATALQPTSWSHLLTLQPLDYAALAMLAAFLYLGELLYSVTIGHLGAPLLSLMLPLRLVVAYAGSGLVNGEWHTWVELAGLVAALFVAAWFYAV